MHNLTLTKPELQRLLKVFCYLVAVVWGGYLGGKALITSTPVDLVELVRAFSMAVTVSGFTFALLYGASWKYETLGRWLQRPIVHGAWCGTLISDYKAKEGVELHIPIVFIIRQTYLTLSVQSYTPTQIGASTLEALVQDARTGDTRLRYVFELTRSYKNENKLTKGAGELRLQNKASELRGFYWTSTPTHGELRLKLASRDCEEIDSFDVARARWPSLIGERATEVADSGSPFSPGSVKRTGEDKGAVTTDAVLPS